MDWRVAWIAFWLAVAAWWAYREVSRRPWRPTPTAPAPSEAEAFRRAVSLSAAQIRDAERRGAARVLGAMVYDPQSETYTTDAASLRLAGVDLPHVGGKGRAHA